MAVQHEGRENSACAEGKNVRPLPAKVLRDFFFFFDLLFHDLRLASLVLHQTSEISANRTQGTEYHESEFNLDTLNA